MMPSCNEGGVNEGAGTGGCGPNHRNRRYTAYLHRCIAILMRFAHGVEMIAGGILVIITIVAFVSVVGRYLFTYPVPDAFDLSRYLLGAAIFWGIAALGFRGQHISVDVLYEVLPNHLRRVCDVVAMCAVFVFTLLVAWMMYSQVESAFLSNETTFDLRLPVWPLLAFTWLGAIAAVMTIMVRIVLMLTGQDVQLHSPTDVDTPSQ